MTFTIFIFFTNFTFSTRSIMCSNNIMAVKESIPIYLHQIGGVLFGEFHLKTGEKTPIYIDFRISISHPKLLKQISYLLWEKLDDLNLKPDCLAGVPYGAIVLASFMSFERECPSLFLRKDVKNYGTKQKIEGQFAVGDYCILIEDVVVSGRSVYETAQVLKENGLKVTDVIAIVDREQGALSNLASKGITLHSAFTLTEFLSFLHQKGTVSDAEMEGVKTYLTNGYISID